MLKLRTQDFSHMTSRIYCVHISPPALSLPPPSPSPASAPHSPIPSLTPYLANSMQPNPRAPMCLSERVPRDTRQ